MEHITKRFPGVLASDDISISVGEGEVLALVGENGAGKTTLMNILMGLYQSDEGRILINDKEVRFRGPEDAFKAGLGMVHQTYMLVHNMTVLENIALGYKSAWKHTSIDMGEVRDRINEISSRYGLLVNPDAYIWQLSVGEQQRVELVKTLCLGARFLILDEPTSALTPQETDELIVLLKNMKNELPIIFISHKLQEVKAISNKVAILRHGVNQTDRKIGIFVEGRQLIQVIVLRPFVIFVIAVHILCGQSQSINLDFSSPGYSKGVQSQHGPLG